jgi:hypothetical protein
MAASAILALPDALAFYWHFMEVLALLKERHAKLTCERGTIDGLTVGYLVY